jgi:hypothetical protein
MMKVITNTGNHILTPIMSKSINKTFSALRNGLITLGDKIKPQGGVDEGIYNTLQEHLPVQNQSFEHTDISRLYLTKVLATVSENI